MSIGAGYGLRFSSRQVLGSSLLLWVQRGMRAYTHTSLGSRTATSNPFGNAVLFFRHNGGVLLNNSNQVKKLALGDNISAAQLAQKGTQGRLASFSNGIRVAGTWASNEVAMAAFQAGNGDLGWIQLKWTNTDGSPDPNTLTAVDWAYNDVPGESIQAGQTVGVPEPDTTAILALAAGAAAALRRRRKAA